MSDIGRRRRFLINAAYGAVIAGGAYLFFRYLLGLLWPFVAAFFFALFFGFMLSDAGYGIILTLATAIILRKCQLKAGMRKYMTLFLVSGISTIFWGAVFGSWFGNLIPTVTAGAFSLKPIWFDPQDSANINHFLFYMDQIYHNNL